MRVILFYWMFLPNDAKSCSFPHKNRMSHPLYSNQYEFHYRIQRTGDSDRDEFQLSKFSLWLSMFSPWNPLSIPFPMHLKMHTLPSSFYTRAAHWEEHYLIKGAEVSGKHLSPCIIEDLEHMLLCQVKQLLKRWHQVVVDQYPGLFITFNTIWRSLHNEQWVQGLEKLIVSYI